MALRKEKAADVRRVGSIQLVISLSTVREEGSMTI